jgi:hypothetical protein
VLDALVAGQMSLDDVVQDFAVRTWVPVSYMPDEPPPDDLPAELQGYWVAEQDPGIPDDESWATVDEYLDKGLIDQKTYLALVEAQETGAEGEAPESILGDGGLRGEEAVDDQEDLRAATPVPAADTKIGDWVRVGAVVGMVDLEVKVGRVPGAPVDAYVPSPGAPALRVAVSAPQQDGSWAATGERVVVPAPAVERISDPAQPPRDVESALVDLATRTGAPGLALKAAYARGVASYPGRGVTALSAAQWGLARASALADVVQGKAAPDMYLADRDLLAGSRDAPSLYDAAVGEATVEAPTSPDDARALAETLRAAAAEPEPGT